MNYMSVEKEKKKPKADGVGGLSLDANPHIRLCLRQNGSVEFAVFSLSPKHISF